MVPQSFDDRRFQMVESQIIRRGIKDPLVIKAMRKVPRHLFVPEDLRELAYEDRPLPIGEGQTISQPYIVAFMTEAAELGPSSKVLEVGTGCGYQTAVLAEICKEVYTIEIVESLAERARSLLKKLGYQNIYSKVGDGALGWPEQAPFDAILVAAAPKQVPPALLDQLALNGHLVIPVGEDVQYLKRLTRLEKDQFKEENLLPVAFVPMTGVSATLT
ncbi:MAG: protein-L-isoaspartate(D-aspartate) O-methyltransferase [Bdellovibrio sp.]|nr:MAG: protein-L-isoaspartate(D-aspartate) O-methyltransferase [Bdellovibrio sp.]